MYGKRLTMKKRKLNYVIHNPNSIEKTAELLLEILIAANADKVEQTLQQAILKRAEENECTIELE